MSIEIDQRLENLISRVETLTEEKKGIQDDIKDVFAEAKAVGYDTKIMKKMIKIRKQTRDARLEEQQLTEVYMAALGLD